MSRLLDLEHFVPFRLNRLAGEISRRLSFVYGERFGIDIPQWRVIVTLGDGHNARAQDIANHTRMHKSSVSRAVSRLIARGLVERSSNDLDRREAPLQLTAEGERIFAELAPVVLDFEQCFLEGLEIGDRRSLQLLLDRLERKLGIGDR
ncbi:MAG: MarR family winged helix-turn-helix transcriptional regulator [Geminicoccaceae bacterium]